jgi:hypothetical protein
VYLNFWPLVSRAWAEIVGLEAILVLVAPEELVPSDLVSDPRVRRFTPVEGIHTAFQAQCIRLLYPALLGGEGAVILSDMELMPLSPDYFHRPLAGLDARFFVSYRDVLHARGEIAIAYSAAEPATWRDLTGVHDDDDLRKRLRDWYSAVNYEGARGGGGWYADQQALFQLIASWSQSATRFWMLDDDYTGFRRLERDEVATAGSVDSDLRSDVMRGRYSDFNAAIPYARFRATNEHIVELAAAAKREAPNSGAPGLRYRLGTARLETKRSWRGRPPRLREPFFSPERELARIVERCRRAELVPDFDLLDYETHQPVLLALLGQLPRARVLELGIGFGSTPILLGRSGSSLSLETDLTWYRRFRRYASTDHCVKLWRDFDEREWRCPYFDEHWDVALVDNSPAATRQSNLLKLAESSRFIVCHDTQECFRPAASNYGWDFSTFRHAWTYTRFGTYTTVVSNHEPIPLTHLPGIAGQPSRRGDGGTA